jgi:hypothetical protein
MQSSNGAAMVDRRMGGMEVFAIRPFEPGGCRLRPSLPASGLVIGCRPFWTGLCTYLPSVLVIGHFGLDFVPIALALGSVRTYPPSVFVVG